MRYTVTPFIDETYPNDVVFVALHLSGLGSHPFASTRFFASGYDLQYIPNAVFGCDPDHYIGYPGPHPTQWINRVETQLALPTDITIDLMNDGSGMPDFSTTATVCMEPGGIARDVRVFVGYTIDDYPPNSLFRYRATLRGMGAQEDIVALAPGECVDVVRDFTLDAIDLDRRDTVMAVAWAQTPEAGFGEAYQAAKLSLVRVFSDDMDATGDLSGWSDVVD